MIIIHYLIIPDILALVRNMRVPRDINVYTYIDEQVAAKYMIEFEILRENIEVRRIRRNPLLTFGP